MKTKITINVQKEKILNYNRFMNIKEDIRCEREDFVYLL